MERTFALCEGPRCQDGAPNIADTASSTVTGVVNPESVKQVEPVWSLLTPKLPEHHVSDTRKVTEEGFQKYVEAALSLVNPLKYPTGDRPPRLNRSTSTYFSGIVVEGKQGISKRFLLGN